MKEGHHNFHTRSTLSRKGHQNLYIAVAILEVVIFTSRGHLDMHNDVKFGKITLRDLYVARCILASILVRAEQELQKNN